MDIEAKKLNKQKTIDRLEGVKLRHQKSIEKMQIRIDKIKARL